jgi:SAM-dependent methyltransferase
LPRLSSRRRQDEHVPVEPRYAPDGSPVELYAALGPLGEPELVHAAIAPGAAILELGAGAGRITHPLVELGHPVVAVDQSAEMLGYVTAAEAVLSDIESLDLRRRFPVVLLASNFLNDPERERVARYLATCVRHVEPEGCVLLQKYPRDWQPDAEWRELGAARARMRTSALDGSLLRGEMEYVLGETTMTHAFEAVLVDDDGLDVELQAAGLRRRRFLDEGGAWIDAVPLAAPRA